MDFRELSYVMAIAKHKNITKAAEELFITQPTLTKFLQNLEQQMGQKLFRKVGNKFLLTYAGERYVSRAAEIMNLKKELDQEMADIIKNNYGSLKIGFPAMRETYMLPCTLPVFKKMYPNVRLDVKEAPSYMLEKMIISGEVDLAFFNLPISDSDIDYEVITDEEVVLIMSATHPLARSGVEIEGCKYPWMDLKLLEDEPFIMQIPGQRTRETADKICREQGFVPNVVLETSNIPAGIQLAGLGYGCFFVTESHLAHVTPGAPLIRFSVGKPCTKVNFVAAFRKNSYLPYHAKEYITVVKNFT